MDRYHLDPSERDLEHAAAPADLDIEPQERTYDVSVPMLTSRQAYALAELCKRISWTTCREMAVSDAEAEAMIAATDRVRSALEQAGVYVR